MNISSYLRTVYDDTCFFVFFFNDTATTEIYTLSLHDALPISVADERRPAQGGSPPPRAGAFHRRAADRKSTRLNSSHSQISYAVFCLKKKKTPKMQYLTLHNTSHKAPRPGL